MSDCGEQLAAERIQTDQEFTDRVADSPLASQQWSLVMTAIEFEVENADDPESAQLVADTSKLSSVMDELRRMDQRSPGTGGQAGKQRGATGAADGLLGTITTALGFGDTGDDQLREAAETLAADYASRLQARLEERGRWEEICTLARES